MKPQALETIVTIRFVNNLYTQLQVIHSTMS